MLTGPTPMQANMTKRRKIKFAFYLVTFSLSLYSISRVLEPIMALASGDSTGLQNTFLQRIIPALGGLGGGGGVEGLEGLEGLAGDGNTTAMLEALISGSGAAGNTNAAARSKVDELLKSIEKNSAIPPGERANFVEKISSKAGTTTKAGTRTIRNVSRNTRRLQSRQAVVDAIAMTPLAERTLADTAASGPAESAARLHRQGKLAEAIATYQEALALEPQRISLHKNLSIAYYQVGNYAAAWESVQAAEALGGTIAPRFRKLLAAQLPDPH